MDISAQQSRGSLLDRRLSLGVISADWAIFAAIMVLSVVFHLWALDVKAMHHDESIHAWMSWKAFTGRGGFSCGFTPGEGAIARTSQFYCYDPVYHGPALYAATALMYFLFGDGDAQARLPMALAGIALTASALLLRPYLGRRGTLLAAALLAFSPSLLYYTRFARHDGLMVLWEFWMVIGLFRYVDTGRPRFLYLFAAATALAVATHELYYILFFIFGLFLLIRLLSELAPRRIALGVLLGGVILSAAIIAIKAIAGDAIGSSNIIGILRGPSLLLLTGSLLGLLAARAWDTTPIVWTRLRELWQEQRSVLYIALAIYSAIYVLLYSSFLAYPAGIVDGAYAGLYYWWFTQHEYARGDQPWYYYLMQLPLYEPLAVLLGIGAALALFTANIRWPRRRHLPAGAIGIVAPGTVPPPPAAQSEASEQELGWNEERDAVRLNATAGDSPLLVPDAPVAAVPAVASHVPLFPLFLAFWFFTSVVAFSWAGEKMPWLVVHMALPGNLLAAWGVGRMLDSVDWQQQRDRRAWLVPPLLLLLLIALGVALWRLGSTTPGVEGQAQLLQGVIPLLIVGAVIYALLTLASLVGTRVVLALGGTTLALLLGLYMVRASWMVNFEHPDVPIEPLVYVQTAPDVPLIVKQLTALSITQTRNNRSDADATGGRSMPIVMDSELAWPLEWYLRDFTAIRREGDEFFKNMTAATLQGSDANAKLPAVVMVYKPNLSEASRAVLEQNYTRQYDTVLNWWFPEGDKCSPQNPGYKRFYFSTSTPASVLSAPAPGGCGSNPPSAEELHSLLAPMLYPFQRENWADTGRYLLFRTLPPGHTITGREMEVWFRHDLAGTGTVTSSTATTTFKLVAEQTIGTGDSSTLSEPRGVTVGPDGKVYIVDTFNHRIQVFDADGAFVRSIGTFGSGDGQLNEPRGVAVDAAGNLYVADTWNARIAKFDREGRFLKAWGEGTADFGDGKKATQTDGTREGNAAAPLGFFGPRAVALDAKGNLYIADTGNKRVVVTDSEGAYKYQWGYAGAAEGAFDEPAGLAVDAAGQVYVADSWNGRVQVFAPDGEQVAPQPLTTWQVPGWQPNTYLDPNIAVSPEGQVFVSIPSEQVVRWTDGSGKERLRWGGQGSDSASFSGPSGLAVAPDGTLYVVDRGNSRVLRFRLPK